MGRLVGELMDTLMEFTAYPLGWLFLRLFTFGKYPTPSQAKIHEGRITAVGFFIILTTLVLFVLIKNERI